MSVRSLLFRHFWSKDTYRTILEDFGYLDGVSQPGVNGFTSKPLPGQSMVDPGIFLLGETGDTITRPAWAKDGSFLAFRQLKQLVPEFDDFVSQNPLKVPGLSVQENTDLFGARIVGRWKSVSDGILCLLGPFLNVSLGSAH